MVEPWVSDGAGVLRLPSGRLVRGRSLQLPLPAGPAATFSVLLLTGPPPDGTAGTTWVRWPDFRLPRDRDHARRVLHEAWERAAAERVEIACRGGRGS